MNQPQLVFQVIIVIGALATVTHIVFIMKPLEIITFLFMLFVLTIWGLGVDEVTQE